MKTIFTFVIAFSFSFLSTASELFIRVNAQGEYYASVSNQTHYNRNNIFKFFDLPGGSISIQVVNQHTNVLLYNSTLSLKHNERVVAQIDGFGNLTIIQRMQIQEVNWYTTTTQNDVYGGNPFPGNNPYPGTNNPLPWGGNNNNVFQQFLTSLKNESMDGNKLTMAKSYVSQNNLTAEQISNISRVFSFDSNRLEFAKHAYSTCYDKNNYFLLKDTFSFSSNYNSLLKFIEGK